AILVGGTFFYLRALLAGLPTMPGKDDGIRQRLRSIGERPRGAERLHRWLSRVDPQSARKTAPADRHRVQRALEVYLTAGIPISAWTGPSAATVEEMAAVKIALRVERSQLVSSLDQRVE